MTTIVPHGISPTGFGIWLNDPAAELYAVSPCCGRLMCQPGDDFEKCVCMKCGNDLTDTEAARTRANLTDGLVLSMFHPHTDILCQWARNVTGWSDLKLEFTL